MARLFSEAELEDRFSLALTTDPRWLETLLEKNRRMIQDSHYPRKHDSPDRYGRLVAAQQVALATYQRITGQPWQPKDPD